ncbi:Pao retrotransposon peptidase [Popillia japonica]|uniref:Pao retrotransposon peptidase n=1 Tax=Popillia japonica TaxID=7064 RepID=A0AAW1MVE9_POPJA
MQIPQKICLADPSFNRSSQIDILIGAELKFWAIEEKEETLPLTLEQQKVEQHFLETHQRSKEGNNMIRIDKNENVKTLGLFWNSTTDTFQIIVNAKLIMQYLWQAKVGWDEPLPEDIYKLWQQFQRPLTTLNDLTIPRQVTLKRFINIELHGFCVGARLRRMCVY